MNLETIDPMNRSVTGRFGTVRALEKVTVPAVVREAYLKCQEDFIKLEGFTDALIAPGKLEGSNQEVVGIRVTVDRATDLVPTKATVANILLNAGFNHVKLNVPFFVLQEEYHFPTLQHGMPMGSQSPVYLAFAQCREEIMAIQGVTDVTPGTHIGKRLRGLFIDIEKGANKDTIRKEAEALLERHGFAKHVVPVFFPDWIIIA